jgi:ubiquinone/menaquinone biosynthesis C-methylase UbiE
MPQILADYTGFDYKNSFWSTEREYEDRCDRLALQKLLPSSGEKFADICGGYGRLASEYLPRFKQCVLFDYAQNLLDQANKEIGPKLKTVQGSAYELPFTNNEFDCCIFVRASHHFDKFEKIISELARVTKAKGSLVIEIANKRHILQIIRFFLGRSKFNPFSLEPVSRNEKGFYNYHPAYVEGLLKQNNFKVKRVLAVSNFRHPLLKKIFGPQLLLSFENFWQNLGGLFKLSPSIYYLAVKNA